MKHLKALTCVLSLIAFSACGKTPLGDGKPLTTPSGLSTSSTDTANDLAYEYTGTHGTPAVSCTTGRHIYKTKAELCLNLQVPQNNNDDCAVDKRQKRFTDFCSVTSATTASSGGMATWAPQAAAQSVEHATGMFIKCDFQSIDMGSNVPNTVHQETSSKNMILLLPNAKASVAQSFTGGVYGVTIAIAANDGSAPAHKRMSWADQAPQTVKLQSASTTTVLEITCTPSITERGSSDLIR